MSPVGNVDELARRRDLDASIAVGLRVVNRKARKPLAERQPADFSVEIKRGDRAALLLIEKNDVELRVISQWPGTGLFSGVNNERLQRRKPAGLFIKAE